MHRSDRRFWQFALDRSLIVCGSAKLLRLREMLPELSGQGHRMLVFSQWTTMLDLLELLCSDLGMEYRRLDGSTPVAERQQLVDDFNGDDTIKVFLLSTRAGGLGLNLTGADTCIFHDLDFNPQNDRQAEDRCHRLGQTRPVTVYKLVAAETVDAKIAEIAMRKAEFADDALCESYATQAFGARSPLECTTPTWNIAACRSGGGNGEEIGSLGLKEVLSEALQGLFD